MACTLSGSKKSLIGSSGFSESVGFHIENLGVKIGDLWVCVGEVLVDSVVVILAKHFIFLNNILLIFIDLYFEYPKKQTWKYQKKIIRIWMFGWLITILKCMTKI